LQGISIVGPTKTTYYQGDELDLSGLVITADWGGGFTTEVPYTACIISGYNSNATGTQTITVAYQTANKTFNVNVTALSITSISITTEPSKKTYSLGETLDLSGLVVTVIQNNGKNAILNAGAAGLSNSGFSSTTSGSKTVTITYTNPYNSSNTQSANFTVTVNPWTVSFNLNGGSGTAPAAREIETLGGNIGSLPAAPTWSGYAFKEWNTVANGSGSVFTADTTVNSSITVYAIWKPIVTFNPNGGNWSGSTTPITVEVDMNTTVSAPSVPVREEALTGGLYAGTIEGDTINYTLNGWRRDGDSANWNFSTPITAPVTLKAQWTGGPQQINLTTTAGDNILAKTLTYIRANHGTYTLLLGENVSYAYNFAHQINNAAINLTVRGLTNNRTITLTNNGNIFYVSSGSLTLGDNITLMGHGSNNTSLVYVYGSNSHFTMTGGNISGNTYSGDNYGGGGGVYVSSGTFTMSGGTISGNISSGRNYGGGGVLCSGTFTMSGGTISGNTSSGGGGGVYVSSGTFTKTGGGTIYGYTAGDANSNKVVNASGVIQNNSGHAVFRSSFMRRETTAGPAVNLDSSVSGTAGGWN
jgi:hypothetical protein